MLPASLVLIYDNVMKNLKIDMLLLLVGVVILSILGTAAIPMNHPVYQHYGRPVGQDLINRYQAQVIQCPVPPYVGISQEKYPFSVPCFNGITQPVYMMEYYSDAVVAYGYPVHTPSGIVSPILYVAKYHNHNGDRRRYHKNESGTRTPANHFETKSPFSAASSSSADFGSVETPPAVEEDDGEASEFAKTSSDTEANDTTDTSTEENDVLEENQVDEDISLPINETPKPEKKVENVVSTPPHRKLSKEDELMAKFKSAMLRKDKEQQRLKERQKQLHEVVSAEDLKPSRSQPKPTDDIPKPDATPAAQTVNEVNANIEITPVSSKDSVQVKLTRKDRIKLKKKKEEEARQRILYARAMERQLERSRMIQTSKIANRDSEEISNVSEARMSEPTRSAQELDQGTKSDEVEEQISENEINEEIPSAQLQSDSIYAVEGTPEYYPAFPEAENSQEALYTQRDSQSIIVDEEPEGDQENLNEESNHLDSWPEVKDETDEQQEAEKEAPYWLPEVLELFKVYNLDVRHPVLPMDTQNQILKEIERSESLKSLIQAEFKNEADRVLFVYNRAVITLFGYKPLIDEMVIILAGEQNSFAEIFDKIWQKQPLLAKKKKDKSMVFVKEWQAYVDQKTIRNHIRPKMRIVRRHIEALHEYLEMVGNIMLPVEDLEKKVFAEDPFSEETRSVLNNGNLIATGMTNFMGVFELMEHYKLIDPIYATGN